MEDPPYHLEIEGVDPPASAADSAEGAVHPARPWLGIRFDCCGAYSRVYRNPAATAYEGRCPRCLRRVRVLIGRGGTSARFFVAE